MDFDTILRDVVECFSNGYAGDVTAGDYIEDLSLDEDSAMDIQYRLEDKYPFASGLDVREFVTVGDVAEAIQEGLE